jgi:hypothetical protein
VQIVDVTRTCSAFATNVRKVEIEAPPAAAKTAA